MSSMGSSDRSFLDDSPLSPRSTLAARTTNLALPSSPPTSPSAHVPLSAHKENTQVCPISMSQPALPASLKRKLPDHDDPAPKKHKPAAPSLTLTLKPPKPPRSFASAHIPMSNACPDYPNGFIYCHQCSKKRDVTDAIQCTFFELHYSTKEKDKEKPPRQRRCVAKFCKYCLKNRYDLEFDDVVNIARSNKKEPGHVESAGYFYKCPKCCDICNCPRCRKSKGLEPMGSAGTIRRPPPEPVPKVPSISDRNKAQRKSKSKSSSDPTTSAKGKSASATKKPKAKLLPVVKWASIPVSLSLEDAQTRFNIREFILRFADVMEPSIPRANLEELEEIGGRRPQGRSEEDEMTGWVSEFCVKSIIIALLSLLAKELHGTLATAIKSTIKDIRNVGVNLNKIWPILASLRDVSVAEDLAAGLPPPILPGSSTPFHFTFPDPLPPPATHDIRAMRSMRNNDSDSHHIAYSAQMIPVISALTEDALLTASVRDEIEAGVRDGKETTRDAREAVKREAERWEQVRKTMESHVKAKAQILENRAKREYHKHKLICLDSALKVVMPKYTPRLAHLGTDMDDRVYWILSPGASEREAAYDFILTCANEEDRLKKGRKKAKALNGGEERAEMKQWSWFVAVWGKRPEAAAGYESKARPKTKKRKLVEYDEDMEEDSDVDESGSDDSETDSEAEEMERWWGFYEPIEIFKLAEWIAMKAGLDDETAETNATSSIQQDRDEQESRASSSTLTLNGSISTLGLNGHGRNGSSGSGKSRDTSVTVVGGAESGRREHLKSLVDELRTFAGLLEWRVREDKYDLVLKDMDAAVGSSGGKEKEKGKESIEGS